MDGNSKAVKMPISELYDRPIKEVFLKRMIFVVALIFFPMMLFAQEKKIDDQAFASFWPDCAGVLISGDKEKILGLFAENVVYRRYRLGELVQSGNLNHKDLQNGKPQEFPLPYYFMPTVPTQISGFTLKGTDSYIKDSMKFAIARTNDGKFCFYIRTRDILARRFFKIYVFDDVSGTMKIVKIVDEAR